MDRPPDLQELLPASIAAKRAGVSRQVFNYWRKTGKVRPVGVVNGHAVYRLLDVLKAERDTRRSGRSHRRLPPPDAYHKVA